jgi:hypothetical protein
MGRTYQFQCPQCHYSAKISGGADSGLHCEVQTVHCLDCRELMDVFIKLRCEEGGPPPAKFPGFFRPEVPPAVLHDASGQRRLVWKQFQPSCPVEAQHTVEVWHQPGRCPRCGNFMEKDGLPYRAWD